MNESPIPWLHIAEEVAREALRRSHKCLGILGTLFLMEGSVYPESLTPLGIDFAIPEKEDRGRINDIILDELVYGKLMMRSWSFHNRPGKPVKVAWNTIQKVHIELWTDIPSRIELFLSDGKKVSINLGDIDGEDREDLIRTLTIR